MENDECSVENEALSGHINEENKPLHDAHGEEFQDSDMTVASPAPLIDEEARVVAIAKENESMLCAEEESRMEGAVDTKNTLGETEGSQQSEEVASGQTTAVSKELLTDETAVEGADTVADEAAVENAEDEPIQVISAPSRVGRKAASVAKSYLKEPSLTTKMRNHGTMNGLLQPSLNSCFFFLFFFFFFSTFF